jgi:hypothetical protein
MVNAPQEESKSPKNSRFNYDEEPPKDSSERVERLLIKLEIASKTENIEEAARELRYLEEFELISEHVKYSED